MRKSIRTNVFERIANARRLSVLNLGMGVIVASRKGAPCPPDYKWLSSAMDEITLNEVSALYLADIVARTTNLYPTEHQVIDIRMMAPAASVRNNVRRSFELSHVFRYANGQASEGSLPSFSSLPMTPAMLYNVVSFVNGSIVLARPDVPGSEYRFNLNGDAPEGKSQVFAAGFDYIFREVDSDGTWLIVRPYGNTTSTASEIPSNMSPVAIGEEPPVFMNMWASMVMVDSLAIPYDEHNQAQWNVACNQIFKILSKVYYTDVTFRKLFAPLVTGFKRVSFLPDGHRFDRVHAEPGRQSFWRRTLKDTSNK